MPMVFHAMPEAFQLMIVRKHLPASPGWTLQPQVDGIVPTLVGCTIAQAEEVGGRVRLGLERLDGGRTVVTADHVIAGTGYRVDMRRLAFLSPAVQERLDCVNYTPRLSRWFESSVPGLHFVGTAAANSFGPMMRFAYGAGFVSRRLSGHLVRSLPRGQVRAGASASARWEKATLAET
jgi:hypothetical protein